MKNLIFIFFIACFYSGNGQNQDTYNEYGELMVRQLSSARFDSLPLIRIRELREFYKERITDEKKLQAETYKAGAGYLDRYREYQENMFSLMKGFKKASNEGATFVFSEIYVEPLTNLDDTYHAELIYIYKQGKIQNEVTLSFDFAWHLETIVLLGAVEEDF